MPSTSTLHAPQLALLQLRFVPVSPSFTAMTSHSVVRASYAAVNDLPLMRNAACSCVIGAGSGREEACASEAALNDGTARTPTAVNAMPWPAAFRKSLRENIDASCAALACCHIGVLISSLAAAQEPKVAEVAD